MNARLPLLGAFALIAFPGLSACEGSTTTTWSLSGSGSSGGASPGGEDGGRDSGSPTTEPDSGGTPAASSSSGGVSGGGPEASTDSAGGGGASDGPPDAGGVVSPATKVTMYVDNWSGSFASWATAIDFNKMTHLLLSFGVVTGTNDWDLGDTDASVQALVAAAHAANVKVLVSIGGEGGDMSIIDAYQSASNIAPLVANLDSMVSALDLDGVDVDLETGKKMTSSSNYPAFVSQLISTFHPEGKLVTSALAQYIVQDQNPDATILATIQSFDFINDMIYSTNMSDYTSEVAWWTGSTIGLPKDKLVWGIEFGSQLGTSAAQQLTTASKAYGGVMCWEYALSQEGTLWPAIQSQL